jgi:5-methylcytosine-specific restriction endonuclease McrA
MSWLDKPLSECLVKNAGHPSWNFSKVRGYARTIYHKYNPNAKCERCGYDKHVEVCHIKPISSFEVTTLLREVNSLENLIGLCPNCHWELDHGFLDFPEFERLQSKAFANDAQ